MRYIETRNLVTGCDHLDTGARVRGLGLWIRKYPTLERGHSLKYFTSMATVYEWSLEVTDEHGDIIDSTFSDVLDFDKGEISEGHLCLIRKVGNNDDGMTDSAYAYVTDGILPDTFDDTSIKVPGKFHTELREYLYI